MTDRPAALILLVAITWCLLGCKERGTRSLELTFPDGGCGAATLAQIYLLRDVDCGTCACDGCIAACGEECTVGCPDGWCDLSELDDGIVLEPPAAGRYAVVTVLASSDDAGVPHVLATACKGVTFDSDGTESSSESAPVTCCPMQELDASR